MPKPTPPTGQIMGQLFFNMLSYGWSEVYYMKATDYGTAVGDLLLLAASAMTIRNPDVSNVFGRISKMDVFGDSQVIEGNGAGSFNVEGTSLPGWNCLDLRQEAGTLFRSVRYLRGLPKEGLSAGVWVDPAGWNALYLAHTALLISKTILIPKPHGSDQQQVATITAIIKGKLSERNCGRPFPLRRGRQEA